MKEQSLTLTGWAAVPVFLTLAATQLLTALFMSLPAAWLVNHLFSANAIRAIFASDQLAYWRCVGLFALWFTVTVRIKWTVK